MSLAIRFHKTGGPAVLAADDIDPGTPGPGEIRVRHTAIGLNFIDTYHRSGLYPVAGLPAIPGLEAAGVIEAVGDGVTDLRIGDRICYGTGPLGAYAEIRVMPADKVLRTPDFLSDEDAASIMLQGLTVQYLIRQIFPLRRGDTILVHAAAGGVGLILCQWASALGAQVIGTVGSEDKARLAREHGCHHTILYRDTDFVGAVKDITGGAGVPVVYDGVGKDTWDGSLDCLARRGLMVSFGNASGPVEAFAPAQLAAKGGLFLTRPSLMHYTATRAELLAAAHDLFKALESGAVRTNISQRFPLAEARAAHEALESRKTTGSTVLTV